MFAHENSYKNVVVTSERIEVTDIEFDTYPEGDGRLAIEGGKLVRKPFPPVPPRTTTTEEKLSAIDSRQEFLEDVIAEVIQNAYSE